MVPAFSIDLTQVLFDGTNFFTFIDTFNTRNTLAQRGRSKEGRSALRIVVNTGMVARTNVLIGSLLRLNRFQH